MLDEQFSEPFSARPYPTCPLLFPLSSGASASLTAIPGTLSDFPIHMNIPYGQLTLFGLKNCVSDFECIPDPRALPFVSHRPRFTEKQPRHFHLTPSVLPDLCQLDLAFVR